MMTDKQIIKPRPICLYEDTCLHLKEKTRLCEDCVHHKSYWSELLEKEQLEKIKSLEQECEKLKKDLHQNFKEKDKLHLIIDRLLEASGYDTNTASAEDFEDVYENMRYEKQQLDELKAENKHLNDLLNQALKELEKTRETLTEIKEIAEKHKATAHCDYLTDMDEILQKIKQEADKVNNG